MAWYDNILGAFSTPNSTAANSSLSTTPANSSTLGSFVSGLENLGTAGVNAYSTVANAGQGGSTSSPATSSTPAGLPSWIWLAGGGAVLLLVILLFFGREK